MEALSHVKRLMVKEMVQKLASVPASMRSLVAPRACGPAEYEVIELPVPNVENPDDVLIKIHAAAINASDLDFASKMTKLFTTISFPAKIGCEGAGVVVAIGKGVKTLRVGDEVYGLHVKRPFIPPALPGFCSEYAVSQERFLLPKPSSISFEEAAACAGTVITSLQCIERGLRLMSPPERTLEGKTVFVTAGLGATGGVACQVLKNVYSAEEVITTVSTAKVPLIDEYLPGVVDKVIDYKTQDSVEEVGKSRVDFVFNTLFDVTASFPLVDPKTGVVVSIMSVPPSPVLKAMLGPENVPFWLSWALDLFQYWYKWKLMGTNIKMDFVSGNPEDREDLEKAGEIVARRKVKPIITVVTLDNLDRVRQECVKVGSRQGGIGKLVIKIV